MSIQTGNENNLETCMDEVVMAIFNNCFWSCEG